MAGKQQLEVGTSMLPRTLHRGQVHCSEVPGEALSSMTNLQSAQASAGKRQAVPPSKNQSEGAFAEQLPHPKSSLSRLLPVSTPISTLLPTGLGDQLFAKYRALEHEDEGKYRVIIVGALMMRAGARIRQADLDHLRELAEGFTGRHGYVSPIAEDGFRHAGKVQFLVALDHYEAGTPRDFGEPSCFQCGKIKADIGQAPKKCGKCGRAWFCNVVCQQAAWRTHKPVCKTLGQSRFLNV